MLVLGKEILLGPRIFVKGETMEQGFASVLIIRWIGIDRDEKENIYCTKCVMTHRFSVDGVDGEEERGHESCAGQQEHCAKPVEKKIGLE